jgi:predicted HicB family RNase H-like nuclease
MSEGEMAMTIRPEAHRAIVAKLLAQPYSRVLIPQEDGRFTAEILEFPGCVAEGADPEAAYAKLEAAAESWLLSCLANETAVPPPLTNYEVSGRFALRLPRSLYVRASKASAREGISLNQYVTAAVAEKLGAQDVVQKLHHVLSMFKDLAHDHQVGLISFAANTPAANTLVASSPQTFEYRTECAAFAETRSSTTPH